MSNAQKFDSEKIRLDLLPVESLHNVAKVLEHGAAKYGEYNWMNGLDFNRVYAAALRHLTAWFNGEDLDPESGLSHVDHALCNLLFLSHYKSNSYYADFDNRPGNVLRSTKDKPVATVIRSLL